MNELMAGGLAVGAGLGGWLLYRAGLHVYDELYSRACDRQRDRLMFEREAQQNRVNAMRRITPNQDGRLGVAYDGHAYHDMDSGRVFTQLETRYLNPLMMKVDAMHRLLLAMRGVQVPIAEAATQLLPESQPVLPQSVNLTSLLESQGPPTFRRLILGVALDGAGNQYTVYADMAQLVHIAVGGSSGWGKSVFLRSLSFQLAKSSDPVDLAMIDLEGATLAPFDRCDRLLWPVADDERDAAIVVRELTSELDRRKALFAEYPGIDSLYLYNEQADEPLDPLVCIVDEATALLENKEIERQLRTLTLRARKYGVWCVLAGQDWKASSLDTAIRNQLSTRVQFRAMSASQSRVLLEQSGAEALDVQGRALAWVPGREMVTLQAPDISRRAILEALVGNGPRYEMPDHERTERERVLAMAEQNCTQRQIEMSVFGYTGGSAHRRVREILEGATTEAGEW